MSYLHGKVKYLLLAKRMLNCKHKKATYQPREYDTNVPESYTCDDCGAELELPDEPDWYLIKKEEELS